jgi:hypothetical protein
MNIEIDINLVRQPEVINTCDDIPRIPARNLSYNEFFDKFMSKNQPVIITEFNDLLTSTSQPWLNSDSSINIEELEEVLRDHKVPIANCSRQYFNSHEKSKMWFSDYANYWRNRDTNVDLLYLKDFHLKHELPHVDFYNVPQYFASDWLNEYMLDNGSEDYRFVYIGVKGTYTNFHSDVGNSYSWSGNVSGEKRWFILPRNEEEKLKDNFGKLPFKIDEEVLREKNVKFFDIIQSPNEIIFVPSGWYHQVHNLTDVFSINHNWFNGCNIKLGLENLLKNFDDVKKEIEDCRDMENFDDHCQVMLKAVYGMNLAKFIDLVMHIIDKRAKNCNSKIFNQFSLGENLQKFDIKMGVQILTELLENENVDDDTKKLIREKLIEIK